MAANELEVWMQGPIQDMPSFVQPVAHTLLQVDRDIESLITPDLQSLLWIKPYGVASIAFHLQHIAGVIDRMHTYAIDKSLSDEQFVYLKKEGVESAELTTDILKRNISATIQEVLNQLKNTTEITLKETRFLGRKKIPTTQIGLLFHAAEHAQRHYGQLLVTVNILKNNFPTGQHIHSY